MNFTEDLAQPLPAEDGRQMREELSLLADFRSLRLCRIFLILALSLLTVWLWSEGDHIPIPLYALLCYFFVFVIADEWCKKRKTQRFLLQSLRLNYHFSYAALMTGQISFCFSFLLLLAIQFAFLRTVSLHSVLLTYTPALLAVTLLLLRYLSRPFFLWRLRRQLI